MIFEEVQRFPVWIKGIVALPVVLLGLLVLGLWT
jgi:hypothetical protein